MTLLVVASVHFSPVHCSMLHTNRQEEGIRTLGSDKDRLMVYPGVLDTSMLAMIRKRRSTVRFLKFVEEALAKPSVCQFVPAEVEFSFQKLIDDHHVRKIVHAAIDSDTRAGIAGNHHVA